MFAWNTDVAIYTFLQQGSLYALEYKYAKAPALFPNTKWQSLKDCGLKGPFS